MVISRAMVLGPFAVSREVDLIQSTDIWLPSLAERLPRAGGYCKE